MRPRGEIRVALGQAAAELHQECGAFTWVNLVERAQVGYAIGRETVKNMASAGDLVRVGKEKPAESRVWMTLFEPATACEEAPAEADLGMVVRGWAEFE